MSSWLLVAARVKRADHIERRREDVRGVALKRFDILMGCQPEEMCDMAFSIVHAIFYRRVLCRRRRDDIQ